MIDQKKKPVIARLPHAGEVIDGRYRLGEALASGGMGIIMKAEQMRTGREVAIKLLHPHIASESNFAARFKREANVATLFDHRAIVRVYDVGETKGGVLYLVMELLQGRELKEIITEEAPLPVGRAVDIGLQMLDGLAEAHSQGVVHRDVKPSNVFICRTRRGEDEVKLLDFGVAKLVNSAQSQVTATGSITGTPSYIAPEVMVDTKGGDRKTADVYAAGLVLLEMLTGQKAFEGGGMAQTLLLHLKKPVQIPEPIANLALGEVIRKSTAKHPDDRYADGDAMYNALCQAQQSAPAELVLRKNIRSESSADISSSILEQIHSTGERPGLDILRELPQHESVPEREPPPNLPKSGRPAEDDDFDAGATQILHGSGSGSGPAPQVTPFEPATSQAAAAAATGADATPMTGPMPPATGPDISTWEPEASPSKKGKGLVVAAVLVALLVVGGGGILFFSGGDDDVEAGETDPVASEDEAASDSTQAVAAADEEQDPTGSANADEQAREQWLRIDSDPVGAEVLVDGEVIGTTQFEVVVDDEDPLREVLLRKEGYNDQRLRLDGGSEEHFVILEEAARAEAEERDEGRGGGGDDIQNTGRAEGAAGGRRDSVERQETQEPVRQRPTPAPAPDPEPAADGSDGDEEADTRDVDSVIDQHLFGD